MAKTKVGDDAVAGALSKIELELGRLKRSINPSLSGISDIKVLEAGDSINQSCNGICSDLDRFTGVSEVEVGRIVTAAAKYNIEQLEAVSSINLKEDFAYDSINQGCNGIC